MTVDETMREAAEGVHRATKDLVAPDLATVLRARVVRRRRRALGIGVGCVALVAGVSLLAGTGDKRSSLSVIAGRPAAGSCSLLSTADVEAGVDAQVLEVQRVAAIGETEKRLCSYRTAGELGTITVHYERDAASRYWDEKDRYLRAFPGAAVDIGGLGDAAYLSGGNTLTVLKGRTLIGLSARLVAPTARAKLIRLAQTALEHLPRSDAGRGQSALGQGTTFVPPTRREGSRVVLPLTLLNGDTLELVYPGDLKLAELGFTPGGAGVWKVTTPGSTRQCCGRTLDVRRGTIADIFGGRRPDRTYPGVGGQPVPFFEDVEPGVGYLAFQFDSWTVLVWDYSANSPQATERMSDEERATWARSFSGHETPAGFLVLDPRPPLSVGRTDSPDARFGDGVLGVLFRACSDQTRPEQVGKGFQLEAQEPASGTWLCLARVPLVVHVGGGRDFQNRVEDELEIRNVHTAAYG